MIKLIVSDFDGTLMPYGRERISDGVRDGLKRAMECGMTVAVSSGRTYGELASYLKEFEEKIYFICCDGAYYVKDGRMLYGKQIQFAELTKLEREMGAEESMLLHGAFRNYLMGAPRGDVARFEAIPVKRMWDVKEPIYKVTAYGAKKTLLPYSGLRMHWEGSGDGCSQIVNRYCDKGAALSDLQMRLMLTKFDTACMGDSGNDVAMMHNAKQAICIGDRCADLKSACNAHFSTAEEALEMLLQS